MANFGDVDGLAVGPSAQVIGRQGGREIVLLQPALIHDVIHLPIVFYTSPDELPLTEQDPRTLRITPELMTVTEPPVDLVPQGYSSSGGLRSLACLAFFEAAGRAYDRLRLTVSTPLFDDVLVHEFRIELPS